jgi:glycosyltransferase involved in cell wall biosynthesis
MLRLAHRAWRLLPEQARRAAMTRVSSTLAAAPSAAPARSDGVVIAGDIDGQNGIAATGRMFGSALAARGLLRGTMPLGLPSVAPEFNGTLPPQAAILSVVNAPFLPVGLARLRPRNLLQGRRMIGVWVWELSKVPDEWKIGAKFVHEIWAPTRFTADAFEAIAPGRVRHVPYPLLTEFPFTATGDRASFGLPADCCVFLTVFNLSSSCARKNPQGAIAAFKAAFGMSRDVLLVLKLTGHMQYPEDFAAIREAAGNAGNIRIMTELLSDSDLHGLIKASDVVMSLHRSEGFGLIPATAALHGVPVVATGYSGNLDFMAAESSALVQYRLVPARDGHGVYTEPGTEWAEPDIEDASAWLRRLFSDAELRARLGKAGQSRAIQSLGGDALDKALAESGIA